MPKSCAFIIECKYFFFVIFHFILQINCFYVNLTQINDKPHKSNSSFINFVRKYK